jgi:hypothetical protein
MQNKITVTLTGETVFEIFDQMKSFMTGALLNSKALPPDAIDKVLTDAGSQEIDENSEEFTLKAAETLAPAKEPKKTRTRKTKEQASEVSADSDLSGQKQPGDVLRSPKPEAPAVVVASKEAVHQALQQVNVAVGLNKAREILSHFKIQRISEIKPESYKEFVDMCNAACSAQSSESMFQ